MAKGDLRVALFLYSRYLTPLDNHDIHQRNSTFMKAPRKRAFTIFPKGKSGRNHLVSDCERCSPVPSSAHIRSLNLFFSLFTRFIFRVLKNYEKQIHSSSRIFVYGHPNWDAFSRWKNVSTTEGENWAGCLHGSQDRFRSSAYVLDHLRAVPPALLRHSCSACCSCRR